MDEEKRIKPAPYPSTDEQETLAITVFRSLMNHSKVKLYISERDKMPNIDGYIELVDDLRTTIGKLEVQIRKLPNGLQKIQCPLSLFAYSERALLPVLFVGVDTKAKRAFWFHVNTRMLAQPLEKYSQETVVIHFSSDNILDGRDTEYIMKWKNIVESYTVKFKEFEKYRKLIESLSKISGMEKKEFAEIQIFLDEINGLLDGKFAIIRRTFYPSSWKIGLAYYTYKDKHIEYTLYPIQFGKNDVLIKEVDTQLHKQLKNEGFGWVGYYKENPIRSRPKKHAMEIVEKELSRILEKKLLDHKGSKFLAQEFIFAFVDKFREPLGLDQKDNYARVELENAFLRHLPFWVHEAIKFLVGIRRNQVKSVVDLLYRRPYFDPEMLLIQIMEKERKQILDLVRERIEKKDSLPILPIGNRDFPFRIFLELLSFLRLERIENVQRAYLPKDFSRLSRTHWVYDFFSPESLEINLRIFFDNLPTVYSQILQTNFPDIAEDLRLFNGGSLIVFVFDFKEEIKSPKDFPKYELFVLMPKEKEEPQTRLFTKNKAEGLSDLTFRNFRKEVKFEGKTYLMVYACEGILDFIYDDMPMFDFVYRCLGDNLRQYFENVLLTTSAH